MSDVVEFTEFPADFSGQVRLFPLPNLVMFPHVIQPLRVFEPRYRQMLEEALHTDRLIAMALLSPGWETDYDGRPPIHSVVCLGHVIASTRLDDGQYNILLQGVRRASVRRELPASDDQLFRSAHVELLNDCYPPDGASQRAILQSRLLESFRAKLSSSPTIEHHLSELLATPIPLGALTDLVAFTVGLELEFKQRLLSQPNVDERATWLVRKLERSESGKPEDVAGEDDFLPPFSMN